MGSRDVFQVVSSAAGQTVINRYRQLPNGALVCERATTVSMPDVDAIVVVSGLAHAASARKGRGQAGQGHRRRGAQG